MFYQSAYKFILTSCMVYRFFTLFKSLRLYWRTWIIFKYLSGVETLALILQLR